MSEMRLALKAAVFLLLNLSCVVRKPMRSLIFRPLFSSFSLLTLLSLRPCVALADAESTESPALPKLESVADSQFSIQAPKGWTTSRNHRGQTLVFEDRRKAHLPKKAGDVLFTPNLTVALTHKAEPIDALQMDNLSEELVKRFGASAGVENYRILESRFVDYRGKSDAILAYADFQLNGIPMSQMHIFLSGEKESALLTYTQLEADFGAEEAMEEIWTSMMSAELQGEAPYRYSGAVQAGVFAGTLTLLSSLLHLLRRRRQGRLVDDAERSLDEDDEMDSAMESWRAPLSEVTRVARSKSFSASRTREATA